MKGTCILWYSSLAEYAASVKLLGVAGPSWEAGRYCYTLPRPQQSPEGTRGKVHCQVWIKYVKRVYEAGICIYGSGAGQGASGKP
jgi:hypothetical protein